ncbi:MAG: BrxA family protein [Syntrophobacteraceae bacterium]|jgi:hypothetical protein
MNSVTGTYNSKAQIAVSALLRETKYVSRLSSRSALYTDFRLLIESLDETSAVEMLRKRVLEGNLLARSSASARNKLWNELRARYILDITNPLFAAFWSEWTRCESESEKNLTAYVLFALNDRLVLDLGTEWLFTYLQRAPCEVKVEDVLSFIDRSKVPHPEVSGWSKETTLRVAQHYMASIRDFGLAQGKSRKCTIRPALYAAPFRLLIKALLLAGVKTAGLIKTPVFRLLAIEGPEIVEALSELNRRGSLHFKMQADVIELNLREVS